MKILLSIFILIFSTNLYADNDLSKAFGQKLRYSVDEPKEPFNEIPFKPTDEQKFKLFDNYYLSVTPKTNKIYAIVASGPLYSTCDKDVVLMDRLLKKKYDFEDVKIKQSESVSLNDKKGNPVFDKNFIIEYELLTTKIYMICNPEENKISVSYIDNEMAEKSREEERDIFIKGVDEKLQELEKDESFNTRGL